MIESITLKGAVYADCRPDKEWVCSMGDDVVSSRGYLGAPRRMMFNRMSASGQFKVASKSHDVGTVWVYDHFELGWRDTGIDSHGVQGHGWDWSGQLAILSPAPDQESMGLRYFDPSAPAGGNLDVTGATRGWITGSPSYTSSTPFAQVKHVSRLFEWTDMGGGVFVGQGDHEQIRGTVIQHPTFGHRLLIDGDSRFVQGHRVGNSLAIAVSRLEQGDAVCFWLQEHEIADLPIYPAVDVPIDPPPPPPPPIDKDKPMSQRDVVEAVNRDFPHLLQTNTIASCGEFTAKVVERLQKIDPEWGFVGKTAGEGQYPVSGMPAPLTGVSYDVVFHRKGNLQVDIIGNGTANEPGPWEHGPGTVIWNEIPREHYRANNPWVQSIPGQAPPPIDPPPPPTGDTLAKLRADIEALHALSHELDERIHALESQRVTLTGKRIALKSDHGTYVCADQNAGEDRPLLANRDSVQGWETFTVIEQK